MYAYADRRLVGVIAPLAPVLAFRSPISFGFRREVRGRPPLLLMGRFFGSGKAKTPCGQPLLEDRLRVAAVRAMSLGSRLRSGRPFRVPQERQADPRSLVRLRPLMIGLTTYQRFDFACAL